MARGRASTESPASSSICRCSGPRYSLEGNTPVGRVVATGKEGFGTPAGDYTILEKVVNKHSTLYGRIVDAAGNTVEGRRRCSPGHSSAWGTILVCPHALLDAPDLARDRDACRTDTAARQSGLTRLHSLAAILSQFSSIKWCGSERRSALSVRQLISRRGLARGRERISDVISDGRQESEDHAQTNYSQSDKNKDHSRQRLLAGRNWS